MTSHFTFGIIGGTGMLGAAIATGILSSGVVRPDRFWVSNSSGTAPELDRFGTVQATSDNAELARACDVILLCVPPAAAGKIAISAPDKLVISVMAGLSLERIAALSGAARGVRAMSSPAARQRLAFSPWTCSEAVTASDRARVEALLGACGVASEVPEESQVELYTALTGPVPGFVAYMADSMTRYAIGHGVDPRVADRATRQLFLAAGQMMARGDSPAAQVREMVDYAGTTAAGLVALQEGGFDAALAEGLDAAVEKTRKIAE
ncbi:NAD(P)-binding domain-containing protein [Pseudooceanicola sp. CBS1P-1]|uniref:Pyrroline-5-carboxylate reductase n=1 Tax=Pseudooceanicola albus TaxID=2692189 RepID=A0A6L7G213_9RHOB|nr:MULTISPECIES: pyrroline-5-carboxylate reductase dimerization domain-containing protein [Pseudooceanicola]MBT9383714.1 NAD(P)-binding domain-containing protein [Pseudooceanicola endophyticus]MXN17568.1 pyrroline-5-carboxylate reductase [Pseudooceanicola albus]